MYPVYVLTDKFWGYLVYKCHYFRITLIRDWCSLVLPLFSRYEEKKVVLRFYGPVNPMGSYRARSVYLTMHTFTGQA